MTDLDRERILKRIIHARGSAAHGTFRPYEGAAAYSHAAFLQDPAVETPIFVRFSTVTDSVSSVDASSHIRRFAATFYTTDGIFDLVGNDNPVFSAQGQIACATLVHGMPPEADPGISEHISAYDMFWDGISAAPESLPMLMWAMSDRAIPRAYRMMEGFGLHTFRMVDAKERATLTKWRWRPVLGTHHVRWERIANINGADRDLHRRDLRMPIQSISYSRSSRYPAWELEIQPIAEDNLHHLAFDRFDPTRHTSEKRSTWTPLGRMVLDRWQNSCLAKTEPATSHPGGLVPGIEVATDPRIQHLIQRRAFSYADRQLHHLRGSTSCQSENSHDAGMQNHADHASDRSDRSNRADHYSKARTFWRSITPPERRHITSAFTFELSHIEAIAIRSRMLDHLDHIDPELGGRVADALGAMAPAAPARPVRTATAWLGAMAPAAPARPVRTATASRASSRRTSGPGSTRARIGLKRAGPKRG